MIKSIPLMFYALFIASCSSATKFIPTKDYAYEPKAADCSVDIFMPGESIDKKSETLGLFSVHDSGLSVDCGLQSGINKSKQKACSLGADAVQFTSIKEPTSASTCFRIQANIVKYL